MTENIKLNGTETKKKSGAKKKKRSHASLDRRKARSGWIFVAPFVIGFLFIYFPIVLQSIKMSFFTYETLAGGGYTMEWVGFEYFRQALFVNPKFVQTLITGIGDMIFEIPAIIILALHGGTSEPEDGGQSTLPRDILHSCYPVHGYYGIDQ